jgi:hypothetical protein
MQRPKYDLAPSFNLWTAQRTWFWSLIYPAQQGGVIGVASSQAEALDEAYAAIERLPRLCSGGHILAPFGDSTLRPSFQNSKPPHDHLGHELDSVVDDLEGSRTAHQSRTGVRTIADSYNKLWQLTLQQYAARVAGV